MATSLIDYMTWPHRSSMLASSSPPLSVPLLARMSPSMRERPHDIKITHEHARADDDKSANEHCKDVASIKPSQSIAVEQSQSNAVEQSKDVEVEQSKSIAIETTTKKRRVLIDNRYYAPLEIGRGSTSVVYEVYDRREDEIVALKMFVPAWTRHSTANAAAIGGDEVRAMRAASALSPYVMPVLDSFLAAPLEVTAPRAHARPSTISTLVTGDTFYYAMPHAVRGTLDRLIFHQIKSSSSSSSSLSQRCTKRRRDDDYDTKALLDYANIERFTRQLVDAVSAVHRAGYVHLDIKPENILVMCDDENGNGLYVLLGDFSHSLSLFHATGYSTPSATAFPASSNATGTLVSGTQTPSTRTMTSSAFATTTSATTTANTTTSLTTDVDRRSVRSDYSQMTLWYRAPEACIGDDRFDARSDAWSLATVVAEMVMGARAWPHETDEDVALAQSAALDNNTSTKRSPSAFVLERVSTMRRLACPPYVARALDSMLVYNRAHRSTPTAFARSPLS